MEFSASRERRSKRQRPPSEKLIRQVQMEADLRKYFRVQRRNIHTEDAGFKRRSFSEEAEEAENVENKHKVKSRSKAVVDITAVCNACKGFVLKDEKTVCVVCLEAYHESCFVSCFPEAPQFCKDCPMLALKELLTPFRLGKEQPLTLGGRELLKAVYDRRTPACDVQGRISEPFGCKGFEFQRNAVSFEVQNLLLATVGSPKDHPKSSMLTPSITDLSCKVFCCTEEQRLLRGGRYLNCPLRSTSTIPLVTAELDSGQDINDFIVNMFPINDPFCTHVKLLCQQISWCYSDLEPHCDRDRRDKNDEKQLPTHDGVGDRITSLTLRTAAWLLFRETANHDNCFAIRLMPGDVYTMVGESRWKWQHAILLDEEPQNRDECRVSIVWRVLEELPQ